MVWLEERTDNREWRIIMDLKGKKTHLMAAGGAAVSFLFMMGWIDQQVYVALMGVFGFGGMAALRAGVKKAEK